MARELTGFGRLVYDLLRSKHGILKNQQKELRQLLRSVGYETRRQNISNWMLGTQPPVAFVQVLTRVFDLTPSEACELYRKYVWEAYKR